MSITIRSEIILSGTPGTTIEQYIDSVAQAFSENDIYRCLITFNGWYRVIDKDHRIPSKPDLLAEYYANMTHAG